MLRTTLNLAASFPSQAYEWQSTLAGKQPWYFTAVNSPTTTLDCRWAVGRMNECTTGEQIKSCTMIITKPNDFAAEVHDRMPVLLTEAQFAPWLSGEAGVGMLKPTPNDYLQRWAISKRVNSSKADADDATLIEPVELVVA
jgi:putative SOS response-associated peptidase YedK